MDVITYYKEVMTYCEELDHLEHNDYLENESELHGSCGHEDDCPSGMEKEYNRGF
jgi:hypothetical protein